MYYYEKNGKINAFKRAEDVLGKKEVSFYSADKENFINTYRRRFIAGVIIAVIFISTPFFFIDSFIAALMTGLFFYFIISFFTSLEGEGNSIVSFFFKDLAMLKFEIGSKLYRAADTDKYECITTCSEIFAAYGTSGFWNKFMNVQNEDILQEATEIAIQEYILNNAISGMEKYIRETSESAIRDEVFHKLDEARDKYSDLVKRFNDFELTVLRTADAERDGKVLQYMEMVDQLDLKVT